ncbi:helix-turn-helix transcriptional regulator [Deinococcus yavapaiensis]|uniref:Proteasome accessory factor B n=1 Tax=Deinococcus yavapaiensis KR-236 TaxID=694435 RepID=A0A318S8B9_9DEIO|nr:WYL domain-containing protein [Deinococcus yavapaiensis]PYE52031.1 proteasome accessory factor B [Deinococcus yavapaiensis KR-236]
MPELRSNARAERLVAIMQSLEMADRTSSELLDRLNLPSEKLRSLQRDLALLCDRGDIEKLDSGHYRSKRRTLKSLNPDNPVEALALYSAARLLVHHASSFHPSYLEVLEMITHRLPEPARSIAVRANAEYAKRPRSGDARTLDITAQAWVDRRALTFEYAAVGKTTARRVELDVYHVEINAHNRAAYAIGLDRSSTPPQVKVFKVARMRNPHPTSRTYDIPDDFDALQFFAGAWGVMTGEPRRVDLLFSPKVESRLREDHFPQQVEPLQRLSDGRVLLSLMIANTTEIKPWLLSWGAEVEVLRPAELREEMRKTLADASALYAPAPVGSA